MKCFRCGYCCIHLDVIIVDPVDVSRITTLVGLTPDANVNLLHKPCGERCPHLRFEGRKAVCVIHDYPWFSETPCFQYVQVEQHADTPCRIGERLLQNAELYGKLIQPFTDKKPVAFLVS